MVEENDFKVIKKNVEEYKKKTKKHIEKVKQIWKFFKNFYPAPKELDDFYLRVDQSIENHDESRFGILETYAYVEFYKMTKEKKEKALDYSWLLHQKENNHHWQSWVFVNKNNKIETFPMEVPNVLEMLCDWAAFAPDLKSFYEKNKSTMLLHKESIRIIDSFIPIFYMVMDKINEVS